MEAKDWDKEAKNYFDNITSPFDKNVKNPIYNAIDSINGKSKSVIDLGTGIGNLIPILSKNFKDVAALDFSKEMLNKARENNKGLKNVKYFQEDMRNLSKFYNKFDVAASVNSIILPSVKDVNKIIEEIYKTLKEKGTFIGIFPALGSVLYESILTYDKQLEETNDEELARKRTYRVIGKKDYDFLLGMFTNENEGKQKFWYRFEIQYKLKKYGFKNIKFSKVIYPWEITEDPNLKSLKDKPGFYDWFVIAEK